MENSSEFIMDVVTEDYIGAPGSTSYVAAMRVSDGVCITSIPFDTEGNYDISVEYEESPPFSKGDIIEFSKTMKLLIFNDKSPINYRTVNEGSLREVEWCSTVKNGKFRVRFVEDYFYYEFIKNDLNLIKSKWKTYII